MYFLNQNIIIAMVAASTIIDTGRPRKRKSSNDSFPRAAISIPTGFPKRVAAEPTFVAITEEIIRGVGRTSKNMHISRITAVIIIMEVTSPISPDSTADTTASPANSRMPVSFFILKISVTNQ